MTEPTTSRATGPAGVRTLRVIGIGPGDPRQITLEAVDALHGVDAFFVLEKSSRGKGSTTEVLIGVREQIC